jgi:hypothetical protein
MNDRNVGYETLEPSETEGAAFGSTGKHAASGADIPRIHEEASDRLTVVERRRGQTFDIP